jgi:hypothetical protein
MTRRLLLALVGLAGCVLATPSLASPPPAAAVAGSLAVGVAADQVPAYSWSPGPAGSAPSAPLRRCHRTARGPAAGEGLVRLTAAVPGTSWASDRDTAAVVDVRVDDLPAQQVVLFGGARRYDYVGFAGPLALGQHCVTVTVRPDLSHTSSPPRVEVHGVALGVVPPSDPGYLALSHAPVLFGRSTSAQSDTPVITYGQTAPDSAGGHDLSYVITWTHEDVGTALVPADEWGRYGRMTDIETVLHEHVANDGRVLSASYLSCGCERAPVYPDLAPELPPQGETDQPFTGSYDGTHAVLRDATGNNDISPSGTTAFRFQQALVPAPGPGQTREAAMDAHPWTYQLSNDEVARQTVRSTDPRSLLPGDYRQYLVADVDATTSGTAGVAIEVQLPGDPTWYSDDYAQTTAGVPSTYPFYDGGHRRTVVKLPPGWLRAGIAALRLRYDVPPGASAPPHVVVHSLRLLGLTDDFRVLPVTPRRVDAPVTDTAIFPRPIA